jgi:hypothetical protein
VLGVKRSVHTVQTRVEYKIEEQLQVKYLDSCGRYAREGSQLI